MNDKTIEQEIQAKGDSPAIRVTPDMITAAIVSSDFHVLPDTQITVCTITLRNGTKVLGYNYGAIDPARQDWAQGRQAAYDMAREKVWELEGYALRERLAVPGLQPIDTAPTDGTVFLGYRERDGRWGECYRIQRDDCEMWGFGGESAAAEEWPGFKPTHWMPRPGKPKQMGVIVIDTAVAGG